MSREIVEIFNNHWQEFDNWYQKNKEIYQSELKALEKIIPSGIGLEIGVGTGRFASCFSVRFGLDPSFNMLKKARERNVVPVQGLGEELPFKNESFHFILIVVTICFADQPLRVFEEAARTLKKKGILILGIIDKKSKWGRFYEKKAAQSTFYKEAHFFSADKIRQLLKAAGFRVEAVYQTLLQPPSSTDIIKEPRSGAGDGGFVAFKAVKIENPAI